MPQSYMLSQGLELVEVSQDRLALSLYGRSIMLDDPGCMIRNFLLAAEQGADSVDFLARHPEDSFAEAVKGLLSYGALIAVENGTSDVPAAAGRECLRHLLGGAKDAGRVEPSSWQVILSGSGELKEALRTHLEVLGIPCFSLLIGKDLPQMQRAQCLFVHCSDHEHFGEARLLNRLAHAEKWPCLYVCLEFAVVRAGPLVIPGANACYECYYHRIRASRRHPEVFEARSDDARLLKQPLPTPQAIHWAVAEATRVILAYLSGIHEELHLSPVTEIITARGEILKTRVLRLPRCPVCGPGNDRRPLPAVYDLALAEMKG